MSLNVNLEIDFTFLGVLAVVAFLCWLDHKVYLTGVDSWFYTWKTPEEKRLQEAIIQKREAEVGIPPENE